MSYIPSSAPYTDLQMKLLAVSIAILACLLISGCKSSVDVVGKWTGSGDASSIDKSKPGADIAAKMLESVSLEIKKDKTFTLTMVFPMEGTWTQSGSNIDLKITKVMGMDMEAIRKKAADSGKAADADAMNKPMTLTVSSDGQTLTGKSPDGKDTMTFKRAKE